MPSNLQTYCKALLLMIVFSMNSIVGFACSFGGFFHSIHHSVAVADPEKNHDHGDKKDSHHHTHKPGEKHDHGSSHAGNEKDECCSDKVIEVDKTEKTVSRVIDAPKLFADAFLTTNLASILITLPVGELSSSYEMIRWRFHSTIPDIRIAIQSFQI